MREGVTLLLPPKEALRGKPLPMATPAPGSPAARDQAPPARATPQKQNDPGTVESAIARSASGPRTYTVQKGDVLSEVAKKTLGSSRRWTEIQAMNADVLDDGDSLVVGMVLKLPVR
ncbi:MAG: LysM peptidoglycan-binding domain-containing protein [Phycisphaerales bacterium]|nr:LysM peptidoglycan-binding domain-containing protein [Phycisphaerales bacterium]